MGRVRKLHLKKEKCWRCGSAMTVAWATVEEASGQDGAYLFPADFDDDLLETARSKGVIIYDILDKHTGELTPYCFCQKCHAFFGNHYLFELVYEQDETVEIQ